LKTTICVFDLFSLKVNPKKIPKRRSKGSMKEWTLLSLFLRKNNLAFVFDNFLLKIFVEYGPSSKKEIKTVM